MHTRMDNPATIRPFAMDAILALHKATRQGGVPQATLELVHLPAREPDQWLQDLALTWAHAMPSRQAKQTSGFSRWRPGGRRPTGPLPNAPPSRPPRLSPGSATGRTRYPTRSGTRLPDTTMKRGLAALIIAVSTVNLWNRFNVTTRQVAGEYVRAQAQQGADQQAWPKDSQDPGGHRVSGAAQK